MKDQIIEIQVKVPVRLNIRLSRDDVESMLKAELCDVVDCILESYQHSVRSLCNQTKKLRPIYVDWILAPHVDRLSEDDCELTMPTGILFRGGRDHA